MLYSKVLHKEISKVSFLSIEDQLKSFFIASSADLSGCTPLKFLTAPWLKNLHQGSESCNELLSKSNMTGINYAKLVTNIHNSLSSEIPINVMYHDHYVLFVASLVSRHKEHICLINT